MRSESRGFRDFRQSFEPFTDFGPFLEREVNADAGR